MGDRHAVNIAKNYLILEFDAQLAYLPTELTMVIMKAMAKLNKAVTDNTTQLLTRRGRAMCVSQTCNHYGGVLVKAVYKLFCP